MFAEMAASREEQVVVFQLCGQDYGVDISSVQQIIQVQSVTRLPKTPDFIKGVINIRGEIIPVLDLCQRFGMYRTDVLADTRVVIVEVSGFIVGLVVDSVSEVLRIPIESLQPPPAMMGNVDGYYLRGIALREDRSLIILLELNKLLNDTEKSELVQMDNI